MDERQWLAGDSKIMRAHLRTVAYRMLGSLVEADDGPAARSGSPAAAPRVVFAFTIQSGKVVAIDMLAHPERLRQLDVTILS